MDATFDRALEGLDRTGASPEERELVELLAHHGEQEGELLQRYRRFAEEGPSPAARYLVALIVEDEQRHHRLLAEMANAIGWEGAANSPVPAVADLFPERPTDESFLRETARLLAHEQADHGELQRLRHRLKPYKDTTIWTLLIDLMLLDTEKHVRVLTFLEKHTTVPSAGRKGADSPTFPPGAWAGPSAT